MVWCPGYIYPDRNTPFGRWTWFARMPVLMLAGLLIFAGGQGTGQAAARCDTIRVNGAFDWYPVIMRPNDTEAAGGVLPMTVAEIARRIGTDVEYLPITPFKRQLVQLNNGKLDVVLGAYWTEERARQFHYSSAVLEDEVAIFVLQGKEFPLRDWQDLKGRLGIRPFGGSYGEAFDAFAKDNLTLQSVVPIPGEFRSNMLSMLLNENVDYAILGRFHGLKMIEEG